MSDAAELYDDGNIEALAMHQRGECVYGCPYCEQDEFAECPVCSASMQWESCWHCLGAGGFHDCGDDCCPCLDKEEITDECPECSGEGGYMQCCALPHTEAQMVAWAAKRRASND